MHKQPMKPLQTGSRIPQDHDGYKGLEVCQWLQRLQKTYQGRRTVPCQNPEAHMESYPNCEPRSTVALRRIVSIVSSELCSHFTRCRAKASDNKKERVYQTHPDSLLIKQSRAPEQSRRRLVEQSPCKLKRLPSAPPPAAPWVSIWGYGTASQGLIAYGSQHRSVKHAGTMLVAGIFCSAFVRSSMSFTDLPAVVQQSPARRIASWVLGVERKGNRQLRVRGTAKSLILTKVSSATKRFVSLANKILSRCDT